MPHPKPKKPTPDSRPSSGIYFVVPNRDGTWRVRAFRADRDGELDHVDAWRDTVAAELAKAWAADSPHPACRRGRPAVDSPDKNLEAIGLRRALADHYDGFPRGRVVVSLPVGRRKPTEFVYHGDNLTPAMRVIADQIARQFSLRRPAWVFDEHEQCTEFSATAVCTALGVKRSWPTVA